VAAQLVQLAVQRELHPHEEAAALRVGRVLVGGDDVRAVVEQEARRLRHDPRSIWAAEQQAAGAQAPWHFLYFLPDPHQHGSLRPICSLESTRRCWTAGGASASAAAAAPAPSTPAPAAAAIAPAPAVAPLEYDTREAPPVDAPPGL